jgi:predicted metal-binding membrane protein
MHAAVDNWTWLDDHRRFIGASMFIIAGAYQWSPLKHRCLKKCLNARSFVHRHWRGVRPAADALRIGLADGVSCVGCCWALMLLLFGVGSGNPAWMLAIGAVMAVEKNVEGGRRTSAPLGVVLATVGLALGLNLVSVR